MAGEGRDLSPVTSCHALICLWLTPLGEWKCMGKVLHTPGSSTAPSRGDPGSPGSHPRLCQVSASPKHWGGSPTDGLTGFPSSAALRVKQAATLSDSGGEHPVHEWAIPQPRPKLVTNPVGRDCWMWKPATELCTMTETLFPFHSKFMFCRAGCPVYIPLRTKNGHLLTSTWADSPKLQTPGLGLQDREGQWPPFVFTVLLQTHVGVIGAFTFSGSGQGQARTRTKFIFLV